jgi:hypothetical protein
MGANILKKLISCVVMAAAIILLPNIVFAQRCIISWAPIPDRADATYHIYSARTSQAVLSLNKSQSRQIVGVPDTTGGARTIDCDQAGIGNGDYFTIVGAINGSHGPKNSPLKVVLSEEMRVEHVIFQCVSLWDTDNNEVGRTCTERAN